jgi:hypothetical protein
MKLVKEFLYEKFEEDSDPIKDMEIGSIPQIKKWMAENGRGQRYKINDDMTVDIESYSIYFDRISNFPDYLKFNIVTGDFSIINSPNFTSLEGLPKHILHDLTFRDNGIQPTEKELRAICDVHGDVVLTDWRIHSQKKSIQKYKGRGPVLSRTTHTYQNRHGVKETTRGIRLWKLLDYIQKGESTGGRRYKEIVQFYYNPFYIRTASSGVWNSLKRYTTTDEKHRYFLNNRGRSRLEMYRPAFKNL